MALGQGLGNNLVGTALTPYSLFNASMPAAPLITYGNLDAILGRCLTIFDDSVDHFSRVSQPALRRSTHTVRHATLSVPIGC